MGLAIVYENIQSNFLYTDVAKPLHKASMHFVKQFSTLTYFLTHCPKHSLVSPCKAMLIATIPFPHCQSAFFLSKANHTISAFLFLTYFTLYDRFLVHPHIKAYMWNLEKWYRRTYFQGRSRDTDVENRLQRGKERVGWSGRRVNIYTLPREKQIAGGELLSSTGRSARCSVMTERVGWGWLGRKEVQEGGDICTLTVDSHLCPAETNTTL